MMINTTLVSVSAVGVLPGRTGSTPVLPHPASNDAPATPAPDIFKNSLRVNVRLVEATPGDDFDPVVRIVEDLGTVEIPCGRVDCRGNCLEYLVSATSRR